ncbi:sigma-70 family RNA polymerase sigma factor [Candidatus Poribacteria bacterium]
MKKHFEDFDLCEFMDPHNELWDKAWNSLYRKAFEAFVSAYDIPHEKCEDLAQEKTKEIFVKLLVKRSFVEIFEGSFVHYVSEMIKHNKSRYYSKKTKLKVEVLTERTKNTPVSDDPAEKVNDRLDREMMINTVCKKYLSRLSDRDKMILRDRVVNRYSIGDLAYLYGLKENTIRQTLFRIRQRLKLLKDRKKIDE